VIEELGFLGPAIGDSQYEIFDLLLFEYSRNNMVLSLGRKSIRAKEKTVFYLELDSPLILKPHVYYKFIYEIKVKKSSSISHYELDKTKRN
jgi:hypothetical protein